MIRGGSRRPQIQEDESIDEETSRHSHPID